MSKIDKLQIQGIRSFRPGDAENIKFSTPLTLIVGHNGSGKTTIIECLKYATTGQLPPNTKGGAFIHDPSLTSDKEVMAQVKLVFKNAGSQKLVCTRSLSLTQKKNARTMKTLDGTLLIKEVDQRTVLTKRNAELNEMMITQLGVSEAVLDNVIFCHQDESLWPMSEPGVLKKKFDEIFEAGKYAKAIDKIKKMKKDQQAGLKLHKETEKYAKDTKDRGHKAEKRSLELQDTIEALRKKVAAATEEMSDLEKEADEKLKERKKYSNIIGQLQRKRDTQEERQKNVEDFKQRSIMLNDSDAELESALAQYADRMAHCDQEKAQYEAQIVQLTKQLAEYRKSLSQKSAEQGQYAAEEASYKRQLGNRIELVKHSASQHGIHGYDGDLEDHQIHEFVNRIHKASKDKKQELKQVQKSNAEALKKANLGVNEIEKRKAIRTQEKEAARENMRTNDGRIKDRQNSMLLIDIDESSKVAVESDYEQLEIRLQNASSEYASKEWDSNLEKASAHLNQLGIETERLEGERNRISQYVKELAELDFGERELKKAQRNLDATKTLYADRITAAVGANWKPETVHQEFQSAINMKSKAVADAENLRIDTGNEMAKVEYKLKTERDTLKSKIAERNSCEKKVIASIEDLTNVDDFEAEFTELESTRDQLKSDVENFAHLKNFWNSCLKSVETKGKCKLCEHQFTGEQEKSAALEKIRKKLLDSQEQGLREELSILNEAMNKALAARPFCDTYKRLSSLEIPALREVVKQTETTREELVARLEKQDLLVGEAEASRNDLEELKTHVNHIKVYMEEISRLKETIANLSSQQSVSSSMSSNEIESQLQGLKQQTNEIKAKKDKMGKEKERAKDDIQDLKDNLQKAERKVRDVTHELEKKHRFAQEAQECKDANNKLRAAIKHADEDLLALSSQLDVAKEELENVRKTCEDKEKKMRDDAADLEMTNTKLQNLEGEIKKYIEKGGLSNLADCKREIEAIGNESDKVDAEKSRISAAKQKLEKEKDTGEATRINIASNIAYRKARKDLEELATEIAHLESLNADEDNARLRTEEADLRLEKQALEANRGTMMGTMRAKDEELLRLLEEHDTFFKDADLRYREAHIKVETTKAAIDDLGKYGDALDQAIMKYHSLKMEDINRIAGELWQNTYQGTDVDTILIRSDNENVKANRSYNYRVCMVKQDVEMDMRGRCSAGQRVLASIIIRLALAECFGVNCGIIALDEPTTNLDQDNIRSLAKSLHDIISVRRAQRNFQLIVITHDEEFLREMQCANFADTYWRVSRNDEQKSIIRMQSIREVLG